VVVAGKSALRDGSVVTVIGDEAAASKAPAATSPAANSP
jgi:hypothetical protein